jgi:hypothetical protein
VQDEIRDKAWKADEGFPPCYAEVGGHVEPANVQRAQLSSAIQRRHKAENID